jgi:hypothetical protein
MLGFLYDGASSILTIIFTFGVCLASRASNISAQLEIIPLGAIQFQLSWKLYTRHDLAFAYRKSCEA